MGDHGRARAIVVGVAVVISVEILIAGPKRLQRASGVWNGDVSAASVQGLLQLLWLPVLALVVLVVATHPLLRARPQRGDASPGADEVHEAHEADEADGAGEAHGADEAHAARDSHGGAEVPDVARRRRSQLDRLLTSGRLRSVGQPIVDLTTGAVRGVEALARFPDGGSPERWFSEAVDAGRGVELELLALRRALELAPHLPAGVYLSLNASPRSVTDPQLAELLLGGPLPLSRVVLELTEHEEVLRYEALTDVLTPLREAGLRLAVDDVGAGYASFRHVLRLRPDIIKLDRSLVRGIDADGGSRAVVTAIALVALEVGAAITAEGVETLAELDTVVMLGVDSAQGYLIGRPGSDPTTWLPPAEVDVRARPGTVSPER